MGRPRTLEDVQCQNPQCAKLFRPRYTGQPYCSSECYGVMKRGVPRGTQWKKPTGRPRALEDYRRCAYTTGPQGIHSFPPRMGRQIYCNSDCYEGARTGVRRGPYLQPLEKQCVVCGKAFSIPRTGGYRRQRACSDECKYASRYRRGNKCLELTPVQASGWAHMIDGEGSIIMYMRRDAVAMMVVVANTHKGMLDELAQETGVGAVMTKRRPDPTRHKTAYWWRCNSEAAETFLRQTRPYLRIKRRQADLALWFQERLRTPALKADRMWQYEARAAMQAMNKRGPAVDIPPVTGWTPPD